MRHPVALRAVALVGALGVCDCSRGPVRVCQVPARKPAQGVLLAISHENRSAETWTDESDH